MRAGLTARSGRSRKYLLASLDQSLSRMGLDYVDIFYSHRRSLPRSTRTRWSPASTCGTATATTRAVDGFIPQYAVEGREAVPDDARAARAWLAEQGAPAGLDMIAEGETPPGDPAAAAAAVAPWAAAGCTWWLETRWAGGAAAMGERLAAGPPRVT